MKRRTFLKLAGFGTLSIAAGCQYRPEHTLFSMVEAPDDMVTGKASWYAATCRECPAGCGVLAKNRDGRIVKLEGHPTHPINRGKLCMRGQAALQGLYNPDRLKTPMLRQGDTFTAIPFYQAQSMIREKVAQAAGKGPDRVRMMTECVGDRLFSLFSQAMKSLNSPPPVVFETFSYDSLKRANQAVFNVDGLVSYRMERADLVIGFGADFLETWLSPVEYARKFKAMHGVTSPSEKNPVSKGAFIHIGPHQSMTAANADLWISCRPGTEAAVALSLMGEVLRAKRNDSIPEPLRSMLEKVTEPFDKTRVAAHAGIDPEQFDRLVKKLFESGKPLVLPSGMGNCGPGAISVDIAANLLNLILDPTLELIDFNARHHVERADSRKTVEDFLTSLSEDKAEVLFLNNVNPAHCLSPVTDIATVLGQEDLFVVAFSNFMDETASMADLVFPTAFSLESWDEYSGKSDLVSLIQPAMGRMLDVPDLGDVILKTFFTQDPPAKNYQEFLKTGMAETGVVNSELDWLYMVQRGGVFDKPASGESAKVSFSELQTDFVTKVFSATAATVGDEKEGKGTFTFMAAPSIRFFDGRGANRPWLCEVPDPITKVAWHTPLLVHPDTLKSKGIAHGQVVRIEAGGKKIEAPVYETESVHPQVVAMAIGQGHKKYGRYAQNMGLNPFELLSESQPFEADTVLPSFSTKVLLKSTGETMKLAHMDGSKHQHERKIALSVTLHDLMHGQEKHHAKHGLTMDTFPMTLPLPEGYDKHRDFYPPHDHDIYRWAMVVDLDRCIGCGACSAACYAENNLGVVRLKGILEQREMSWLDIQRYIDPRHPEKITFLPMLCQHCDNAPCESVCPVYAPHHSKQGLNNQIYNRCIGTRFCSQNCPYKVRRFNWFAWKWPDPMNLQLNPDVTVRSKGVMEKCSFCVQRIKKALGKAKDENREIRDGEVQTACLQTCPTGVFTFGNLMDKNSQVRKMVENTRAYQIMGYLNTKPAVIYLKKVVQEI